MAGGTQVDPEALQRLWGWVLPNASDFYDEAIERMATVTTTYHRSAGRHPLAAVEGAWRGAIDDAGCVTDMLRGFQRVLLDTADAVRLTAEQYGATDQEAAMRLAGAQIRADEDGPTPPPGPTVELGP